MNNEDLVNLIAYGEDAELVPPELLGRDEVSTVFQMVRTLARYALEQEGVKG